MVLARVRRAEIGFSLVELMVSMVLGLMLIAGAVSVYLASKRSYVEVEHVAALTENARFAEQVLGDSLRHMGFLGEVPPNRIGIDASLPAVDYDPGCVLPAGAEPYNLTRLGFAETADSSGGALGGCIDDAAPGTDVLVIKHALPLRYFDGDSDGDIDTPDDLEDGKTYVMTNDVSGLLFDGASPPSITVGGAIPGGSAWEYQYEVFYVRRIRDDAVPELVRRILVDNGTEMEFKKGNTESLAEGVENLRLLFGFDSAPPAANDPNEIEEVDKYEDVASVTSSGRWNRVQSVEVYMLVRSATNDVQYTDNKTYRLGGVSVGPFNDDYRRMISFTSVSLRNLKLLVRRGGV